MPLFVKRKAPPPVLDTSSTAGTQNKLQELVHRPSTPLGFRETQDCFDEDLNSERLCAQKISEDLYTILGYRNKPEAPQIICPAPRPELLPSLLQEHQPPEPCIPLRARQNPSRYHGHSKSALVDYKVFWNARYDDWARWQAELEDWQSLVYEGIQVTSTPPPRNCTPVSSTKHDVSNGRYRGEYIPKVGAPIYPRTGNLASLRHPVALERERWFAGLPLHKIHKILFAYNMDHRYELEVRLKELRKEEEEKDLDASFASDEDTLVGDSQILMKDILGPRYQEAGAWEVDWDVKWELLLELIYSNEGDAEDGDLSDVCRAYLDGSVVEEEEDEDDCIIYTGFDELVIR